MLCIPEMADEMAAALAAAKSCDMGDDAAADEAAPPHPAVGGEGDELEAAEAADGEASAEADCQAVAPARSMVSSERASSPLVE